MVGELAGESVWFLLLSLGTGDPWQMTYLIFLSMKNQIDLAGIGATIRTI